MDKSEEELAVELSRQVVAQVAPVELPLFASASRAFLEDPDGWRKAGKGRDEVLGFGLETAAIFMTPVVLSVVTEVLKHIAGKLADEATPASRRWIGSAIRKFLRLQAEADNSPRPSLALSTAQLAQVRSVALAKAAELRLSQDRADLLADSIIGNLAAIADH